MNTDVTTPKTFEQRMFEKVRESIGDLMTEGDLKKIVDKAMQKAFFEERVDSTGYRTVAKPAVFVEMMQAEMSTRVGAALQQWVTDNPLVLEQTLQRVIDGGVMDAVTRALEDRMSGPLTMFAEMLRTQGVFK